MSRSRFLSRACFLCGLTFLTGCGDDAAPEGPAVRELPELYAENLCPEVEHCLGPRLAATFFGEQGCEAYVGAQGDDGNHPALQSAIDEGRVKYDASKVDACLEQLAGIGCGFNTERAMVRGTCEEIFTGTVAIGDPCDVDEECKGIAFCKRELDASGSVKCPGTCSELLGPGEPCDKDDQCEDGLRCDDDGTCAAPAEEGEACGGNVGTECAPGLSCIGADDMTGAAGECKPSSDVFVGDEGEACDFDTGVLCKSPLSCIVESFTAATGELTLVCAKGVAAGDACKFGAPSQCPIDQRCDADISAGDIEGTCVPLPQAGEPCAGTSKACAPGLHCDLENKCHPLTRLGNACTENEDCASRYCKQEPGEDPICDRPVVCEL